MRHKSDKEKTDDCRKLRYHRTRNAKMAKQPNTVKSIETNYKQKTDIVCAVYKHLCPSRISFTQTRSQT